MGGNFVAPRHLTFRIAIGHLDGYGGTSLVGDKYLIANLRLALLKRLR